MTRRNWFAKLFGLAGVSATATLPEKKPWWTRATLMGKMYPIAYINLTEEDVGRMRKEWEQCHKGIDKGQMLVIPSGSTYKPVSTEEWQRYIDG